MFRILLLAVRRLSPEDSAEVEQEVAGAKASFEALDPATKEKLLGLGPSALHTRADLAVYTVLEDDGRTSEQRDVIAPVNDELAPGSEVALEGQVSTLFRTGSTDDAGANVSLNFAERIVAADWEAFWSQAPGGPAV